MYDIIGDIHGHADELEALLLKMGYSKFNGIYTHPERKTFFLGDFIDRGPKIRETLNIVRPMIDSGNALGIMGNHEYNAICFHVQESDGGHLRKHSIKNILQHYETLWQFKNRQEEYDEYLEWFQTLPLFFENENFRAVHACWDSKNIEILKDLLVDQKLDDQLVYQSVQSPSIFHTAIEETLKGKEMQMPGDLHFYDKDGSLRREIRIKWWENPKEMTLRNYSVLEIDDLPDAKIEAVEGVNFYEESEKPVFFGHYWLGGEPQINKYNACCLDYSVAKGGNLVAYRYDGEHSLRSDKIVYI